MKQTRINLLGATGSIGTQTLEICRRYPDIRIHTAAVQRNHLALAAAAREFDIKRVCIFDEMLEKPLKDELFGTGTEVISGIEGLCSCAADTGADCTVNAIVGAAGLLPTDAAIRAGIKVALANKETLVAGGSYIMKLAKQQGVDILPVDSEHSAIMQSLMSARGDSARQLKGIILTASGGPFLGKTRDDLVSVTPEQALKHPNWNMGHKITIDSATLMNKGFELIEACHLFNIPPSQVEIVIHRQSVIHSAVVFCDNAVIAQLGVPDMTIPIQFALTYPERFETTTAPLSLTDIASLTFSKPDRKTFTCLKAALCAAEKPDTTAGAVINGANEKLVELFLEKKIAFTDIFDGVNASLNDVPLTGSDSLEAILAADKKAREYITEKYSR